MTTKTQEVYVSTDKNVWLTAHEAVVQDMRFVFNVSKPWNKELLAVLVDHPQMLLNVADQYRARMGGHPVPEN